MFVCSECGGAQATSGRCSTDGTPLSPIGDDILLGTTIGVYRVARLLGIGGMGRVYKGVHPSIGSRVAIKVLSRECTDRKELVDRFFSEARAVNVIRHESIVNVLDLAMLPDGRPYIIMEYLDGSPLAGVIAQAVARGAPMPLGGLARLVAEVLDALGAAHAKGIVHRDLKPDNVFVTPNGRAKVLDFGIAKLTELGGTATRTGSLLGTPHYMAPEQAAARPVDHRADLYAIGIILFECATGTRPFEAASLFDLLRKHLEVPPPSPRGLRRDMPAELEQVILVALAKSPDERFANSEAMSVALQRATAQLPPDQWAPITGSGVRPHTNGFSPTPPASWARSGQSSAPPPNVATVSAGQITGGAVKKPARRGLWIAGGAVAVLGGSITVAALASRGSAPGIALASDGSATAPSRPEVPAEKLGSDVPVSGDREDDKIDELSKAEQHTLELIKQLPADKQVELAPLVDLARLPKAERKKRIAELGTLGLGNGWSVPSRAATPPASDGWLTAHALTGLQLDPKHADTAAYIPWAIAQARQAVPDAALTRIDLSGVRADGFADLTLPTIASDHGSLDLRFVATSRTTRDPKVPLGVRYEWKCELRVEAEPGHIEIRPINGFECKDAPLAIPRCTTVALWRRAIAAKPELAGANAVASISYYGFKGGKAYWYFAIAEVISERFDDDC